MCIFLDSVDKVDIHVISPLLQRFRDEYEGFKLVTTSVDCFDIGVGTVYQHVTALTKVPALRLFRDELGEVKKLPHVEAVVESVVLGCRGIPAVLRAAASDIKKIIATTHQQSTTEVIEQLEACKERYMSEPARPVAARATGATGAAGAAGAVRREPSPPPAPVAMQRASGVLTAAAIAGAAPSLVPPVFNRAGSAPQRPYPTTPPAATDSRLPDTTHLPFLKSRTEGDVSFGAAAMSPLAMQEQLVGPREPTEWGKASGSSGGSPAAASPPALERTFSGSLPATGLRTLADLVPWSVAWPDLAELLRHTFHTALDSGYPHGSDLHPLDANQLTAIKLALPRASVEPHLLYRAEFGVFNEWWHNVLAALSSEICKFWVCKWLAFSTTAEATRALMAPSVAPGTFMITVTPPQSVDTTCELVVTYRVQNVQGAQGLRHIVIKVRALRTVLLRRFDFGFEQGL
jgi:hypothetical protein